MANKNVTIKKRNASNTGWDEMYPVTTAENVKCGDGSSVEAQLGDIANYKSDSNMYQIPTIVGTQIQLQRQSDTKRLFFKLESDLSGGDITISMDGGTTLKNLKDIEGINVTELSKGFIEVVEETSFFIYAPRYGGIRFEDYNIEIAEKGITSNKFSYDIAQITHTLTEPYTGNDSNASVNYSRVKFPVIDEKYIVFLKNKTFYVYNRKTQLLTLEFGFLETKNFVYDITQPSLVDGIFTVLYYDQSITNSYKLYAFVYDVDNNTTIMNHLQLELPPIVSGENTNYILIRGCPSVYDKLTNRVFAFYGRGINAEYGKYNYRIAIWRNTGGIPERYDTEIKFSLGVSSSNWEDTRGFARRMYNGTLCMNFLNNVGTGASTIRAYICNNTFSRAWGAEECNMYTDAGYGFTYHQHGTLNPNDYKLYYKGVLVATMQRDDIKALLPSGDYAGGLSIPMHYKHYIIFRSHNIHGGSPQLCWIDMLTGIRVSDNLIPIITSNNFSKVGRGEFAVHVIEPYFCEEKDSLVFSVYTSKSYNALKMIKSPNYIINYDEFIPMTLGFDEFNNQLVKGKPIKNGTKLSAISNYYLYKDR